MKFESKILQAFLLACIALASGCATRNSRSGIPGDQPVNRNQTFDPATGRLLNDSVSYEGQIAASRGALRDNSGSEAVKALAPQVQGTEFSYGRISRTASRSPEITDVRKLETEHKASLEKLAAAAAGGPAAYAAAAEEAAKLGQKLVDAYAAANADPDGDQASVVAEILTSGTNHVSALTAAVTSFSKAIESSYERAGKNTTYTATDKDITSTEDLNLALKAFEAYHSTQVELGKLKAETERLKAQQRPPSTQPSTPTPPSVPNIPVSGGQPEPIEGGKPFPTTGTHAGHAASQVLLAKQGAESGGSVILLPAEYNNRYRSASLSKSGSPDRTNVNWDRDNNRSTKGSPNEKGERKDNANGIRRHLRWGSKLTGTETLTVELAATEDKPKQTLTVEINWDKGRHEGTLDTFKHSFTDHGTSTEPVENEEKVWYTLNNDGSILILDLELIPRVKRAQVYYRFHSYLPDPNPGDDKAEGFLADNRGKNTTGVYTTTDKKPLSAYETGPTRSNVWVLTGNEGEAGIAPFGEDGNFICEKI